MLAIKYPRKYADDGTLAVAPIWDEAQFECHSRVLGLPVMHTLLAYLDLRLRDVVKAEPAAAVPILLCKLQPLAAFLGYAALASIACAEESDDAAPDPRLDMAIVGLSFDCLRNMLDSLPALAGQDD